MNQKSQSEVERDYRAYCAERDWMKMNHRTETVIVGVFFIGALIIMTVLMWIVLTS